MKNKPISHKNENTFKFRTFSERLADINVDVIHRIRTFEQTPEEADTFFFETLQKWTELNCTEDFDKLCKDLGMNIQSLPQIVHKKDVIIAVLNNHLQDCSNLALDATLELVVALARDLQMDFYPFFPKIFSSVVKLLDTKSTEMIENVFVCLSYLFKFLWRYMVKDIENVFITYLPLLKDDQKEYIRNFAAESFAFLVRKVNDKEKFFIFMFHQLEENSKMVNGFAQLLFHVMKGVRKEFHSCMKPIFSILINCLGQGLDNKEEIVWDEFLKIFTETLILMAKYTEQKNTVVIWNSFFEYIEKLLKYLSLNNERIEDVRNHLCRLISLFQTFICYRDGKLILSVDDVSKILLKILNQNIQINCMNDAAIQIAITLISHHYTKIPGGILNKIICSIYSDNVSQDLIFNFTRNMFSYCLFEKDILPSLLTYCEQKLEIESIAEEQAVLLILTEFLCTKLPSVFLEKEICSVASHTLLVNSRPKNTFNNLVVKYLSVSKVQLIKELPKVWSALICLPFVKNLNLESSIAFLLTLADVLCKLCLEENTEERESLSFILCHCLNCLCKLQAGGIVCAVFSSRFFINLMKQNSKSINSLLLFDVFLTYVHKFDKSVPLHELYEVFEILLSNLMSPYHIVRFLTLKIFNNLSLLGIIKETTVFKMCLDAESIPATFQEIRHKIQLLQKLKYDQMYKISNYDHYKQVPLYYLIGMLYINFKLLWQPVKELIASYVVLGNAFWDVYIPHLTSIYNLFEDTATVSLGNLFEDDDDLSKLFHQKIMSSTSDLENPDHMNHRILLWQAMEHFINEAESRNRYLVTLLFYFICNEFHIGLSFFKNQDNFIKLMCNEELSKKNFCSHTTEYFNKKGEGEKNKVANNRIISGCILLSFRDPEIQKLAFDCLITFGHKSLKPYSENFYRLLDNKTFKTETVLFNLEGENGIIQEEHRVDVLPVLMRILYGKMLCKTGNSTSGKNHAQTRRNLVLRFLAGCKEDEIQIFIDIAFFRFKHLLNDDILTMVKNIKQMNNLMDLYPLRIQISALNTLGTIFNHLRNLISTLLPKLYQILIAITSIIVTSLENSTDVPKSSRTICIKRLIEFFKYYDLYLYSEIEIDAAFETVVWNLLPRLEKEALNHRSPLLRLFATWCENPRYHSLLVKSHPRNPSLSPLSEVMRLYCSPNVKPVVIHFITDMIIELLTSDSSEMEQNEMNTVNENSTISESSHNNLNGM
ncbi:small subunit processome component 20 homolog [Centruroides sculpturatus]|uniref:small subunit processome component 20 homolog n=1 Tax=Centruroides sculpturatus TaxID=218467 RepID=UPI000C6D448A|nr:small subunit processome component 20 homolog [Centruroides sculpturatus]